MTYNIDDSQAGTPLVFLSKPLSLKVPLIVSCPHVGTEIPAALVPSFYPGILRELPDTDWYVDQIYSFVPGLGAPLITARWSRYVIDLNRDPNDRPLYQDGRTETGLIPVTTFGGAPLTLDHGESLRVLGKETRLQDFYWPYHEKINSLITELRKVHPHVLLWEAHSISRFAGLKSNQRSPLPDIMIGDRDGTSCHPLITDAVYKSLASTYQTVVNNPYKGGYLTKHFASPKQGIHTIQLEMSQDLYLVDPMESGRHQRGFPSLSPKAAELSAALQRAISIVLNILSTEAINF